MAGPKQGGWLRGVVKEIPSGDTVTIVSGTKLNAPEKRITLSSLIAPKLGKRDGSTPDEAFAWESREFLRKLAIGKTCTFRVDYTLENIPGREFGSVFVAPSNENLALKVVAEGWAKVRTGGGSQSPYIEQLTSLTEKAEAQKKGIFSQDGSKVERQLRSGSFDAQGLLDRVGKGKPLPAIVEQVSNGSMLRVTLLDAHESATVQVCGIQCPSVGRRPVQPEAGSTEAAVEAVPAQPFALEAKHFTELSVLNREVRIVLQGADKHDNVIGTVLYPSSSQPESQVEDLGLQLVQQGLAKVTEWGLQMMGPSSKGLREAEREAKKVKKAMWHDFVPPASAGVKLSDHFTGTVVEIVSGDVICVKDTASGVERRVTLSSIKAPRVGNRDRPGEPYARESKEFLRQRLIGKEVQVAMEYSRKIPLMQNGLPIEGANAGERQMDFGTILIKEKIEGQQRLNNVATMLLTRGLATVVKHRTDDERSAHYESLLEAEQAAIKNRKGLHKPGDNQGPAFHANDISTPGNAAKAKQHLPYLTRNKSTAVVEAVLSGNRLKLYIEKEGIMLAFSPSGVRAPQRPQNAQPGRPAVSGEPYWEEALTFTRHNFLQREVEIEIETMDKGGSFLGTVTTKPPKSTNLGLALLSHGLAKLHPSFNPSRTSGGRDLVAAEERAREKRLKVWENYVKPEATAAVNGDAGHDVATSSSERVPITVTDLSDTNSFYIQKVEEPRVQWITEQLQSLDTGDSPANEAPRLKTGNLCLARFSLDKQLYRAKVEHADNSDPVCPVYHVSFIDFGNKERVKATSVKAIDTGLSAVPPQAFPASLAYLKVKGLDDEVGSEAARTLAGLTGNGKKLYAQVTRGSFSSTQPLQVVLHESTDSDVAESVNARILEAGLARFSGSRHSKADDKEVVEALQAVEDRARKEHVGMWQYGDPGEESDDDDQKPKNAWGRR